LGATRLGADPERLLARLGGSLALHISLVLVFEKSITGLENEKENENE
jgi:hypothetical protein